jgi:hypothetical protein
MLMEALREIHEVHSNSITIHLPNQFAKQVEVIVLPVEEKPTVNREDVWKSINEFSEELRRSGRTFSDSVELIREGRGE